MGDPRHAVVTGGNKGIGLACAEHLAAAGFRVTVMGRDPAALAECGFPAIACDVTDEGSVRAAFAAAGHVDVLVANAGASMSAPVKRQTLDDWNWMLAVNATSVMLCAREVVEPMRANGWGRVVTLASVASHVGGRYVGAYTAAKHAALGFTRALATELAGSGVTANAVCPAYVRTPMTERTIANIIARTGMSAAEAEKSLIGHSALGRLIESDEVAAAVDYLCSDAAAAVNGQSIILDGGSVQQ